MKSIHDMQTATRALAAQPLSTLAASTELTDTDRILAKLDQIHNLLFNTYTAAARAHAISVEIADSLGLNEDPGPDTSKNVDDVSF